MINNIYIYNDTKKVIKDRRTLGIVGENGYEILKFTFDEFIDGIGILEIQRGENKYYVQLEKGDNCYLLEVKNSLLTEKGEITMQLVVRQPENRVFKSVEFTMEVLKAIEATTEIPDEYETWDSSLANKILEIDSKLEEITDLQEDLENKVATDYFKGEKGDTGDKGDTGAKGDPFTYEDFTEEQLAGLKGQKGDPGTNGSNGADGFSPTATVQATQNGANISITDKNGTTTVGIRNGIDGQNGQDGRDGVDGKDGTNGSNGLDGKSAYQIWIDEGNSGTEQDFLDSLKGEDADTQEIESELSDLREENTRLKNDLNATTLSVSATGENIMLENTAEARFKKFKIQGNSKQETREGYNLLDVTIASQTTKGVTFTINDDKTITCNGTAEGNILFKINEYFNLQPNTDYIMSSGTVLVDRNYLSLRSIEGNVVSSLSNSNAKTFNTGETTEFYICIYVTSGNVLNNLTISPMIVKAEDFESVPPYQEYGTMPSIEYPSEIKNVTGDIEIIVQNKNSFDINDFAQKASSEFSVTQQNGEVTITRTNSSMYRYPLNCKENTVYTLTLKIKNPANDYYVNIRYSDNTSKSIYGQTVASNYVDITQTTDSNKTIEYFEIQLFGWNNQLSLKDIQLEEGATNTEYIQHQDQTFIFPLGNEKLMLGDYLADDGIHHVRRQIVYDGDEAIFANTNSGNIYAYILPTTNKARNTTVLSNYFSQISEYNGGVGIFSVSNINVCIKNISTVSEFKSWLSTHNLLVEFGLEEEVVVPYTVAQQAVYNQIKNTIKTYSGETNIYSTNEVSPVFDVVAYKDINSVINSLDNRITLLE